MVTEKLDVPRAGRPTAETSRRLDDAILTTAERLFVRQGYAATSMEQIAVAAGSGKQTIYRRYRSKEDLFKAVIADKTRQLAGLMPAAEIIDEAPLTALRQVCRSLLDFVCSTEVIGLYRVLIAEAERFPALIAETVRDPHELIIQDLLAAARDKGEIQFDGAMDTLCHALSGLITGWTVHEALTGKRSLTDPAHRSLFFESAWTVFLHGAIGPRSGRIVPESGGSG
jgi:AcrR family transcriptional regulator